MVVPNDSPPPKQEAGPPERTESLWLLIVAPTTWALHFTVSYATAAVWCAKVAPGDGSLGSGRALIGLYTLVALAVIGHSAWHAFRRHKYGSATAPHDDDTAADRHRFLGFSTLLLASLSLVATLFTAMVAVAIGDCR